MFIIRDNKIVEITGNKLHRLEDRTDKRVQLLESLIAEEFNTTIHKLDLFYKDSNAKLMCCFMLHVLFDYSIATIAKQYNINRHFLGKNIREYFVKCIKEDVFFNQFNRLKDAFFSYKLA